MKGPNTRTGYAGLLNAVFIKYELDLKDESAVSDELKKRIQEVLRVKLRSTDAQILCMLYGLTYRQYCQADTLYEPHTQKAAAEALKFSIGSVRSAQKRGLAMLRHPNVAWEIDPRPESPD